MNAVAKVKEDVTEVELDKPVAPPAGNPRRSRCAPSRAAQPRRQEAPRRPHRCSCWRCRSRSLAGGSYVWLTGGRYQETENANLRQAQRDDRLGSGRPHRRGRRRRQRAGEGGRRAVRRRSRALPHRAGAGRCGACRRAAERRAAARRLQPGRGAGARRGRRSRPICKSQFDRAADLAKKGINAQSPLDEAQRDLARRTKSSTAPRCRASTAPARRLAAIPTSRPTSTRPCSPRSPRATRPPSTWRRPPCARRPTASSARRPPSRSASSSPPARRCSAWSRPATPGSRRTSRKRSSPT